MPKNRDGQVKDKNFWESLKNNSATYIQYYNRLTELSVAMFKWNNLPPTVDARYLELALFGDGSAVFFKDETMGYLALRSASGGELNAYGIPTKRTAYGSNGYSSQLDETNSVLIYNNMIHTNCVLDVEMFAQRLFELDRIIDVNIRAQKTPVLIKCAENQRLTLKQIYKQYDGNQPFIFADDALDLNGLTVLKTDAPYVADNIYELKTRYWNEALTYLGISNINIVKKERQVTDEVLRSQGGVIASRYSRMNARNAACDEINRMFGLNISVEYNEDIQSLSDDSLMNNAEREEDKESGEVHNGS